MSDYVFIYWDDIPLSKPSEDEKDTNVLPGKVQTDRST
jgi:hypothetical protein